MPTSILDLFRLDGRVALVTGAASGLGASIAKALAEAGAQVAVHGNRRAATDTAAEIGPRRLRFKPTSVIPAERKSYLTRSGSASGASTSWSTTREPSTVMRQNSSGWRTGSGSCR